MKKGIIYLFSRYIFILILAIFSSVIYSIFKPVTLYLSYFILHIFYSPIILGNSIVIGAAKIILVDACTAGAAYLLLIILNFSLKMGVTKRIYSLIFSLSIFLAINIIRIVIFSILFISSFKYFDVTHLVFWYILSGIIIFIVWVATVLVFKIKGIPFYTDLKYLYNMIQR